MLIFHITHADCQELSASDTYRMWKIIGRIRRKYDEGLLLILTSARHQKGSKYLCTPGHHMEYYKGCYIYVSSLSEKEVRRTRKCRKNKIRNKKCYEVKIFIEKSTQVRNFILNIVQKQ